MFKTIIRIITGGLGRDLVGMLKSAFGALAEFFRYKDDKIKAKAEKERAGKVSEAERKVDEACDSGGVQDLFDAAERLRKAKNCVLTALVASAVCCGCATDPSVSVYTAEPYEGRYSTVEDFRRGTERMVINEGESVWVLTSETMKRLLKTQR